MKITLLVLKKDFDFFSGPVPSHTRRSDASEKKQKKIACPLLDVFACAQVSSPLLYRLNVFLYLAFDPNKTISYTIHFYWSDWICL